MNVTLIYNVLFIITLSSGLFCFYKGFLEPKRIFDVRYRAGPLYRYRKLKEVLHSSHQDAAFLDAGINNMNFVKYKTIRKLILYGFLILAGLKLIRGKMLLAKLNIGLGVFIFYITSPQKSFFTYILKNLSKKRKDAMDEELTGIIIQMKNLILSCDDVSADYILTRVLPFSKLSKPAFSEFLKNMRRGDAKTAGKRFTESFGTKLGGLFANVLILMDELPQREFIEQLDMLKQRAESEHRTRREAKNANVNILRYGVAMLEGFLIVADFLYLICIDSIKLLLML